MSVLHHISPKWRPIFLAPSNIVIDSMIYKALFKTPQEVDGESLMTLDPEMMVKLMNIKAGPALRIHNKIVGLKKQHNIII